MAFDHLSDRISIHIHVFEEYVVALVCRRSGDGSLICCYSLNNPVTDARYSGQLSESCSLVA